MYILINGIKSHYTNIATDAVMIIVSLIITQVKPSHVNVHADYPAVNLQITAGESRRFSMRGLQVSRGRVPRVYCHRSTPYIVHCVGDVIMPARYE
jgi:hypothetical protein